MWSATDGAARALMSPIRSQMLGPFLRSAARSPLIKFSSSAGTRVSHRRCGCLRRGVFDQLCFRCCELLVSQGTRISKRHESF